MAENGVYDGGDRLEENEKTPLVAKLRLLQGPKGEAGFPELELFFDLRHLQDQNIELVVQSEVNDFFIHF